MSYFTINPLFYYVVHKKDIEDYITIETGGLEAYNLNYSDLKSLVRKYVNINSAGIDESNIDYYVLSICDKLMCN